MKKRMVSLLFIIILSFGLFSNSVCAKQSSITYSVDMYIGDTASTAFETEEKIEWKSSNNKVAVISSKGEIIAKNKGRAKIVIKNSLKKRVYNILVKEDFLTICISAYGLVGERIWNEGFCDVYNYIVIGKDEEGNKIDIDETIEEIGYALEQIDVYDNYFNKQSSHKYSELKKAWTNLYNETYKLYNKLKRKKPKACDKTYNFSVDKFLKYDNKFADCIPW